MYNNHFEFSELPFTLTPDTSFFLNKKSHQDALNTTLLALKHCEGFIKIVGEVGTGKTLLSRILLARLTPSFVTAYIPNPYLTPAELKSFVAQEVGAKIDKAMPSHELMSTLYRRLVQHHFAAVKLVKKASGGIPRLINIICHKALICAYGRGHKTITAWHVARAVMDTAESKKWISVLSSVIAIEAFSPKSRPVSAKVLAS